MRVAICFLLSVFLFSACQLTTENEGLSADMVINKQDPVEDGKHAILTFDEQIFKFGTISQGEQLEHTFNFENTGETPLLITAVKPSCGCTLPKEWPKHPIAPGEEGKIEIQFDSNRKSGKQNRSINIVSNAIPQTTILYLEGEVIAPVIEE